LKSETLQWREQAKEFNNLPFLSLKQKKNKLFFFISFNKEELVSSLVDGI